MSVMDRIRKLMQLATNNPNEHEATSAALKAQRLMVEHDINSISEETADINFEYAGLKSGRYWKFHLSSSIAPAFRCRSVAKGRDIGFFGELNDRQICMRTFLALYEVGHKLGLKAVREYRRDYPSRTYEGVYGQYVTGFTSGVVNQLTIQSKALMVIVSPEVNSEFSKKVKRSFYYRGTPLMTPQTRQDGTQQRVWADGYEQGQKAVSQSLEAR